MALLGNPSGKLIYELGFYPGTGIYYFGKQNSLIGVGRTTPELSKKVESLGHRVLDLDLEKANNDSTHARKADILLVMEILEHIRNPLQFLQEAARFLKPGGKLYLTTNNASYIGYILKLLSNKPILDPIATEGTFYPGHTRYYSLKEISDAIKNLGFTISYKNHINFLPKSRFYKNRIFGALKNIFVGLCPRNYATHIELIATKKS